MGVDSLLIVWFPTIRKECRHSGSQEYILLNIVSSISL